MSSLSRCNAAAAEYLTFAVAPFSQDRCDSATHAWVHKWILPPANLCSLMCPRAPDSAGAVSAAQRFSSYAAWASNHSVPLKYFDSDAALNGYTPYTTRSCKHRADARMAS